MALVAEFSRECLNPRSKPDAICVIVRFFPYKEIGTYLKNVFWPPIGVEAAHQALELRKDS